MSSGHPVASWRKIKELRRQVLAWFPRDQFLATVFEGCVRVARDRQNPLRGNLAAAGLREAVGHILHGLAPDEEVRRCVWFEQAKDTPTVTRVQRATFILQAGLPRDFVKKSLGIDVKAYTEPLIELMNGLNKPTHVRPDSLLTDSSEIREMFEDVLLGLDELMVAARVSREEVQEAVGAALHNAVTERLVADAIQELDELSTHTAIDYHLIDAIEVRRMTATEIVYGVTGNVYVELQYGSNSDVRNDIGFRTSDSFPYEAQVTAPIAEPEAIDAANIELTVDNSSFFE
jgi:hypothetical protein